MAWTILAVVAVVLLTAAVVYDIVLTTDKIDGNTFSELLREFGMKTPFFPWVFAALAGRWFHPSDSLGPLFASQVATYIAILAMTALVVGAGIVYKVIRGNAVWIPPWLVVLVGLPFGAFVAPVTLAH